MAGAGKGTRTRNSIIEQVNMLFNEHEKLLTLDEIAAKMGLSKSRITNHFPKKELLILAIFKKYGEQYNQLLSSYDPERLSHFKELIELWGEVMDLIYEYRFSLSYVFVNPMKDEDLVRHFNESYERDKQGIYQLTELMVRSGMLDPQLLRPDNFEVYLFKFVTLFSTWIITLKIYDTKTGYEGKKPVYLKGLISCFEPYLTGEGKEEYQKAIENLNQQISQN